jgi:hypothetical protein
MAAPTSGASQKTHNCPRAPLPLQPRYTITTPKSDASVRDVDIPPHIIPAIEDHLAKFLGKGRDSLVFFAEGRRAVAAEHVVPVVVAGPRQSRAQRSALA